MKKHMLRDLPTMEATNTMIEKAQKDTPKKIKRMFGGSDIAFKYGVYIRCQVIDQILNVALYLADNMKTGSRGPSYELYIDKKEESFITWDVVKEKWSEAKVDRLSYPLYTIYSDYYISGRDNKVLKDYLGSKYDGYYGIRDYQLEIREKQLVKKHKKETDPWDEQMELIPKLPKDWKHWVHRHGMKLHFIFYDYVRGGASQGYCTWCHKEVPIKNPKHNKRGKCQCCGHEIKFKSRGKAGSFYTGKEYVYLIQSYRDGFVIREFNVEAYFRKGDYEQIRAYAHEERRVLYKNMQPTIYNYGDYKQRGCRWMLGYSSYWLPWEGVVYKRNISTLAKKELRRTGLPELISNTKVTDPEYYLKKLKSNPHLEQLIKAGLFHLANEILLERCQIEIRPAKSLAHSLGIDKNRMSRLRAHNGGKGFLTWLKYEKSQDKIMDDSVIQKLCNWEILPKDLKSILNRMSEKKICNYLRKQTQIIDRKPKELVSTWYDYLAMAERLKMNTDLELIYRPKNLIQSHNEAVELCSGDDITIRAYELSRSYPDVDAICTEIKEKFEFEDEQYMIKVPERIEDILLEGQILRHCADSDIYYARIQNREAYVVFLRNRAEPDKPYYTIEVEPNGTIRQKRTVGDNQNADIEMASVFLRKWQQAIQKRLTEEDHELAGKSAFLREQGYKKLRKDGVKIWNGKLKGQLLADVLEADLMEVSLCESQCG